MEVFMNGTIIAINKDKGYCDLYQAEATATYRSSLEGFTQDPALLIGSDCEFEAQSGPSFFSPGKAKLISITPLEFKNEKVALTKESNVADHELIKDDRNYLIGAEGGFERECRSALIEKALECHANALLDLKLEVVTRPGVKAALFRYTARPGIIEGPKYHQEPGQGLTIPTKVARRNSPNEAMVRYIRVLLICFLFIAIPCILSLTEQGIIPSPIIGQMLTAGILVLEMFIFMFISFRKRQSFILNLKNIRNS